MRLFLFGVVICWLTACDNQDDGSYVAPITLYEKVHGEWSLMKLTMIDEFARANGITPDEQNLSTLFNYPDFRISFNVDEAMNPTRYQVMGDVPPLFEPEGFWMLSSDFQPTNSAAVRILLYQNADHSVQTGELRLTSVPGSNGEMEIQLVRITEGVPFVSYVFNLNASNP
ncbi:DUF5004 domain-containing protein [Robertkochia solimangrovi]|uniref:DUF5004 domain-containing protein n=1 Tax=Robertkochia solimangrovi TaxID=2213046 RepID=UPI00117CADF1|nr:DUF5004 domain-containing protein [Robertkochia solimangrovi]TRZ45751.1 DUF5004 domain-containing protein [Robertkochia solimangrovi]